jgi:hypothetical protein
VLKRIQKLPRRYRAAFILSLFTLTYLLWGSESLRYFGGWVLLLWVLFPENLAAKAPVDKTRHMLPMLAREDDRLRVGMEQVAINSVKKVALDIYDDDHAILTFPYTSKISANYLFPRDQFAEVRAWFEQHTPELEIIR